MMSAFHAVRAGACQLGLVIGVEKLIDPTTGKGRFDAFDGALDNFDEHEWKAYYAAAGEKAGKVFG